MRVLQDGRNLVEPGAPLAAAANPCQPGSKAGTRDRATPACSNHSSSLLTLPCTWEQEAAVLVLGRGRGLHTRGKRGRQAPVREARGAQALQAPPIDRGAS